MFCETVTIIVGQMKEYNIVIEELIAKIN